MELQNYIYNGLIDLVFKHDDYDRDDYLSIKKIKNEKEYAFLNELYDIYSHLKVDGIVKRGNISLGNLNNFYYEVKDSINNKSRLCDSIIEGLVTFYLKTRPQKCVEFIGEDKFV